MAMYTKHAIISNLTPVAMTLNSNAIHTGSADMADITCVLAGANGANSTFATGTMAVDTVTTLSKASSGAGDYFVISDASGLSWAAALNTAGSTPAPTGATWVAIPSGQKVNVNVSGATTATDIVTLLKTALNALTGFTAAVTLSGTSTLVCTMVVPGPVTAPSVHNTGDTGAGTITATNGTAGVVTAVSVSADTVTITAHGYLTGMKITALTTTGTLPAGLATSTVYYAIAVDANTLAFATSQANALAGTKVDITGYGATTSVNTVSVATALAGSVIIQKNIMAPEAIVPVWVNVSDSEMFTGSSNQTFAAAATLNWLARVGVRQLRAVVTVTSGTVTATIHASVKDHV